MGTVVFKKKPDSFAGVFAKQVVHLLFFDWRGRNKKKAVSLV